MSVPTVQSVSREITELTNFLVTRGFVDDQNYPLQRQLSADVTEVQFANASLTSSILRNRPYVELYDEQRAARSYNLRMLDGALVQMTYKFHSRALRRSRLAFLPSPDLSEFQNEPEFYLEDVLFAEVVDRRVVTVPIRFDFDDREAVAIDVEHPRAHLTLGQYKNCRVATTAPLTPGIFMGFILRSFYNTALNEIASGAPAAGHRFDATITKSESALLHVAVP
jgi:hypothetical protein